MWYVRLGTIKPGLKTMGLEENIAKSCAEHAIMKRMFLRGDYDPSPVSISKLTKRVLEKIESKFGSFNLIRNQMPGETIQSAVDSVVDEVMS